MELSEAQIEAVLDATFAHVLSEQGSLTCAFVKALRADLRTWANDGWCKYDVRAIRARVEEAGKGVA